MKKLSIAVAVAATLGAGVAGAYTVAEPSSGVLVPNVIHGGGSHDTTAVGFINHGSTGVTVYWTFFDENSGHVTDGQFPMTAGDYAPFIWSDKSGLGLENKRGYLVFHVGTGDDKSATDTKWAGGQISAAAFQLNAASGDAAYIPVFPVKASDLDNTPLRVLGSDSLMTLASGGKAGQTVDMRYEMDAHWDSRITLWSTGGLKQSFTVNMFDDNQNRKSVNFVCPNTELCFVDPTTIIGRPAEFQRGYIRLVTKAGTAADVNANKNGVTGDFVSYTVVNDKAGSFGGATQTILNSHWQQ